MNNRNSSWEDGGEEPLGKYSRIEGHEFLDREAPPSTAQGVEIDSYQDLQPVHCGISRSLGTKTQKVSKKKLINTKDLESERL